MGSMVSILGRFESYPFLTQSANDFYSICSEEHLKSHK